MQLLMFLLKTGWSDHLLSRCVLDSLMGMVNNGIVIPPSQCLEMMGLILTPDKSLVNYSVIYTDAIKSTILKELQDMYYVYNWGCTESHDI